MAACGEWSKQIFHDIIQSIPRNSEANWQKLLCDPWNALKQLLLETKTSRNAYIKRAINTLSASDGYRSRELCTASVCSALWMVC